MEYFVVDDEYVERGLPARAENANKYDFGYVLCICGSRGMHGAGVMAAKAALKSGAGIVTLAVPKEIEPWLYPSVTEIMVKGYSVPSDLLKLLKKADVCVLGCGLGKDKAASSLVEYVLENFTGKIVLDADGINIAAMNINMIMNTKASLILTPHSGEMGRLVGMSSQEVEDDREIVALDAANRFHAVVMLKGASTVIASPKGKIFINHSGNPGMATAGSGDVLAGITGALAAVMEKQYKAAAIAAYIHGMAGDAAAQELSMTGMTACDMIDRLPSVFKKYERRIE